MKNKKENTCPQCRREMPSNYRCPACFFGDEDYKVFNGTYPMKK